MTALIDIRGVSKRHGERFAVRQVSLAVPRGQFVAVVGASGSGKTTLLKTINRLIEPDEGEVLVDGRKVGGADPVSLRRSIGYVFQGVGLFPHMTVGENISIGPRLLGEERQAAAVQAAELLELVGLPPAYAARAPAALSGGERQRVGVARALAGRPSIMLMDEPFGALDPVIRDDLGRTYADLHQRLGLTTLMVTHDIQEAVLLADRIVVMKAGAVIGDDTPRSLLSGHPDADVTALMAMPRRQAGRVQALMTGSTGG